jgi:FKBP-type peptidyl-prolyl cis-trans isomerase
MKKVVILTSLLCVYNAVHADAACCGTKRKREDETTSTTQPSKKIKKAPMKIKQKTASGLEYAVLEEGPENITPKTGATVTVHYTGWLKNDNQPENENYGEYADKAFDSSLKRGQKFQFTIGVGQVIRGWDEGVMGMKVGEKRRLYIPSALGYGARGAGGAIPPHADLVFDVELFDVSK